MSDSTNSMSRPNCSARTAYALAAGAAAAAALNASGAIVYSGVQDIAIAQFSSLNLNIDGDASGDLLLKNYVFGGGNYQGQFGFQVASCSTQYVGFYTNNASFFNGSFWSLFAFGQDPCTQVANFSVTIFKAPCSGDIDLNGSVDAADLASILAAWFSSGKGLPEDLNGDGSVDAADLSTLLANWGTCP